MTSGKALRYIVRNKIPAGGTRKHDAMRQIAFGGGGGGVVGLKGVCQRCYWCVVRTKLANKQG